MQIRIKFWGKILIGIAILAASLYVGFAVVRTTTLHTWGSTYPDIQTTRPGDELVGQSLLRWDHAITINAPADQVWPWIAQLGDVRAAYYSYTFIENLIAGQRMYVNADRIIPEYQHPQPGDGMIMDFLVVHSVEPGSYLLAAGDPAKMPVNFIWLWQLEPLNASQTRLIVRMQVGENTQSSMQMPPLAGSFIDATGFVMERKMMEGIKLRAEGGVEPGWYQPAEIALWLLAFAVAIVAAVWFVRRNWLLPLIVGLLCVGWLFYLTYVQPALWLRAGGDLLLLGALWVTNAVTRPKKPEALPDAAAEDQPAD